MNDADLENMIRLVVYLLVLAGMPLLLLAVAIIAYIEPFGMMFAARLVICILLVIAGGWMIHGLVQAYRDGRAIRAHERRNDALRFDPVHVAQLHVHDMLPAVKDAMTAIEAFRTISGDSSLPIVVDAQSLIDGRLPAIMRQLVSSSEDTTPEEKQALSRRALVSVVSIGEMATRARTAVVAERERLLSIETGFVETKSAPYRDDGLTPV